MDWLNLLKVMMLDEKAAQAKYQLAVDLAKDPEVRAVFERLRDEEVVHLQLLEGEYVRLEKGLKA